MRKIGNFALLAGIAFAFSMQGLLNADAARPHGIFFAARIAAKRLKKMKEQDNFSGADQDKNGKLSKDEIEKHQEKDGKFIDDETFKKIDKNGDGELSHAECDEFHKELEKAHSDGEKEK